MRARSLLIVSTLLLGCGSKNNPTTAVADGGRDSAAGRGGTGGRGGSGAGGAAGSAGVSGAGGAGGSGAGGAGPIDAASDTPVTMSDGPVNPPVDAPAPNVSYACANLPRPADPYRLVVPFPNLPPFEQPTAAVQAPGQPEFWYVTEQAGAVRRFANRGDVASATTVLDLENRVDSEGDAGILAITFHPKFAQNGQMFLSYALAGSPLRSRLSRFTSSNGGASFDVGSEEVLIEIPQGDPEKIHLNCDMRFGPDGFLWAGFGDGGYGEDSRNEAQSVGTINGKILRIDVDRREGGRPYAIPADNPFVGRAGARGEVWAIGFRNPWRWRFDPTEAGVLWVGELGSDRREELDKVVRGGNYGWNKLEGNLCWDPPCSTAGLTPPHVEYPHLEGRSITAGPVYRGQQLPGLRDRVVYGDFVSGNVWALPPDRSPRPEVLLATQLALVSFGEALDEELYLLDFDGGRIHKVAPGEGGAALPTQLSQTGCLVSPMAATPQLVPYDVNAPLWSDGASKRRWMALPPGGKITVAADGDFQFPGGSTLVKEFSVGNTKTETRLFVRHADGAWAGYSYAWNAEQTEATLIGLTSAPVQKTVGGATWHHPSRSHCMGCHTPEAGFTLGLEVSQLNRTFNYPDGARNQLAHLSQAGLLAAPLGAPESLPALPDPAGGGALAARARAYLHANCSSCHRPNVRFPDGPDLRFTTAFRETRTCNQESVYGGFDGAVNRLVPGQPEASVLTRFMKSTDEYRMPLVGTTQVDQAGVTLVEGWIRGLSGCQ